MPLRVKNWRVFQHYKDRSPPWIKLQKSLLDDYDFQCLPLASKALAPMLWLLASESHDGSIEDDAIKLAFRLRWSEKDVRLGLSPLIEKGFLEPDSNALAPCLQVATSETERETETECASAPVVEGLDPVAWAAWMRYRREIGKRITKSGVAAAQKALAAYGAEQAAVVEQSIANGWRGLFELKRPTAKPNGKRSHLPQEVL